MPKKSKREKLLAEVRRRHAETQHVLTAAPTASALQTNSALFHFSPSHRSTTQEPLTQSDTTELIAIKKDLTKTVVLAVIAVAAELALFMFERR